MVGARFFVSLNHHDDSWVRESLVFKDLDSSKSTVSRISIISTSSSIQLVSLQNGDSWTIPFHPTFKRWLFIEMTIDQSGISLLGSWNINKDQRGKVWVLDNLNRNSGKIKVLDPGNNMLSSLSQQTVLIPLRIK